jgi:hypothetical protein
MATRAACGRFTNRSLEETRRLAPNCVIDELKSLFPKSQNQSFLIYMLKKKPYFKSSLRTKIPFSHFSGIWERKKQVEKQLPLGRASKLPLPAQAAPSHPYSQGKV